MKKYMLKRTKIKNQHLKYDFLPPMLEVLERPSNPVGSLIIWGIVCLVITAFVWAAFWQLDVVVSAVGSVAPKDNLVLVQAESGGMISEIFVNDGDVIAEGDVVAQLDKSVYLMDMEQLQYQKELLETQKAVYEKIYEEEWEDIEADSYGDFSKVVSGILEEQNLYLSQVKAYDIQIQLAEEEDKKVSRNAKKSYEIQHKMELLQSISSLEVQLAEVENDIKRANSNLEMTEIIAPVSGIISQMQIAHTGEMVSALQEVGYILPEGAEMVFKCYVSNGDITHIENGQAVEVKLDAYPYSRYGTVLGQIDYIDEIAVNLEGIGTAYAVYIALEPREDIVYKVGLSGSCDIRVSARTVLEYFLEPIQKGMDESLDEL